MLYKASPQKDNVCLIFAKRHTLGEITASSAAASKKLEQQYDLFDRKKNIKVPLFPGGNGNLSIYGHPIWTDHGATPDLANPAAPTQPTAAKDIGRTHNQVLKIFF